MIMPPPKFLNAMPERGAGNPRRSTFSHPTYPAALTQRTRCWLTAIVSGMFVAFDATEKQLTHSVIEE